MAEIVGAKYDHEITLMNSLTVNLHLMMQVSKFIILVVLVLIIQQIDFLQI